MKRRTRYTATAIALATLAALTLHGPASSTESGHSMKQERSGMMGMGLGPRAMHDLDLNRSQVRNITRSRREAAGEGARVMAELQEHHWELNRAMAEDEPDAERIGQLHLQIRENQQELARIQQQTHERIMKTLSDEQREQLQERDRRDRWDPPVEEE
ncbi:Spy/CpxP family protein refolding chaperone [Thiohalospira sp.]|uniref:Spy/CpxP family protein refolding chaperone n=1 Tax=Thiohalospira sp. TaxID=3080549 RepID=UPI003980D4C5